VFGERLANAQSWWRRCRQTHAGGFLMTGWEPQRLAFEMPMVVDAAAACLWLNPEIDDHAGMLAKGFERVFGKAGSREAARAALACDEHAFAGYAKWETHDRWDGLAGPEGPARANRSAKFFTRLAKQKLPAPFIASASLNAYLASRESFIRQAARSVAKLRRSHATGQTQFVTYYVTNCLKTLESIDLKLSKTRLCAREIWARTRDPRVPSPYAEILDRDAVRLKSWRAWLTATAKNLARSLDASPVHGRWQLSFIVHNHAPALQKILVEEKSADGTWKTLAERFTIEFRAKAARPRANLKREFSVSIDSPARPLRIALRGIGEVAVSQVTFTDGVITLHPKAWPARERRTLGTPAPTSGFPDLHLASNRDAIMLSF
ncbi:MAG: glycoside hydrolase family 20, partial [Opitutaceae bacterium]|nr:glycoside hydrolase family 20 [Opitutaceae bacterium]